MEIKNKFTGNLVWCQVDPCVIARKAIKQSAMTLPTANRAYSSGRAMSVLEHQYGTKYPAQFTQIGDPSEIYWCVNDGIENVWVKSGVTYTCIDVQMSEYFINDNWEISKEKKYNKQYREMIKEQLNVVCSAVFIRKIVKKLRNNQDIVYKTNPKRIDKKYEYGNKTVNSQYIVLRPNVCAIKENREIVKKYLNEHPETLHKMHDNLIKQIKNELNIDISKSSLRNYLNDIRISQSNSD
ncbi:hypothetical protein QTN25_007819 [Entamoeba marina]